MDRYLRETIAITDISTEGHGIGRTEAGRVVATAGALPGDSALVEVYDLTKGLLRGKLIEIVEGSPARCAHPCSHHGEGCPASPLGAYSYDKALEWKRKNLAETLRRVGGIEIEVSQVVASPKEWGYRERVDLGIEVSDGKVRVGYQSDNGLTPIFDCWLAEEGVRNAVQGFTEQFREAKAKGRRSEAVNVARILFRANGRDGVVAVLFLGVDYENRIDDLGKALNNFELTGWEIRSVESLKDRAYRSNLARSKGDCGVTIRHGGGSAEASALSFSQVNPQVAKLVDTEVSSYVVPSAKVLDLFGGWGMFGLTAANAGGRVLVVDSNEESLKSGETLSSSAGLDVRYEWGDLDKAVAWGNLPQEADIVIVDPPRRGLTNPAKEWLNRYGARRLIYISCHPAALSRDVKALTSYRLQSVKGFDMFPQTPDLEVVAVLGRV